MERSTLGAPLQEVCTRGHDMAETRKRYKNGESYCGACKTYRSNQAKVAYPERTRRYRRTSYYRKHYGVDLAFLDGRPCDICGKEWEGTGRRFHVDHDHQASVVRGVLCHHCNTALGLLRENPVLLQRAIEYLNR